MQKRRVEKLEDRTAIKEKSKVISFYRDDVTDEEIQKYKDDGYFVIVIEFVS